MAVKLSRRTLLTGLSLAGLLPPASAQVSAKVMIIGGGFGGATAAMTLARLMPSLDVTLIEPNPTYTACPFSNLVIGGDRSLAAQDFDYKGLEAAGISIVVDHAEDIDGGSKTVTLRSGGKLAFDRLILSPGIDLRWSAIEGYDEAAANLMPHAWKAGQQTRLLRNQIREMDDGGVVVMSAPPAPYRCPPGPYERASLIAHYLKTQKPKSKLLILDSKQTFSKMPLFLEAWAEHYPDHLEWRAGDQDGRVSRVDASIRTVFTDFEDIQVGAANIIPPQKAGWIADRAGAVDATGWCPIDPLTFESTLVPGVHVIGDATIAAPMPKSAFSANLQGKICAMAVARLLSGLTVQPTVLTNTCYSYTTPETAVSITGVYSNQGGQLTNVADAGGLSPLAAPLSVRRAEAEQAEGWFSAITAEAFG